MLVCPVITISGDESISAVSRPVTVFVAPGPEVTSTTPGLPGRAGVAVGHVGRALLVAHEDQLDLRVDQGVEDRDRGAAREPEDQLDPLALQALHELLGAGRDLRCHEPSEVHFGGRSLEESLSRGKSTADRRNTVRNLDRNVESILR